MIARHLYDLTAGAFDVAIGTGLPSLELDADEFVVGAAKDGIRVDLGGIGKGYAVDLMAELIEDWGLERALVHGGFSSVLALESPAGRDGWPLTLSDPAQPSRVLVRLSLSQTALSASGTRKGDHIIDPRTGSAVGERRGAWAALPRPARAVRGTAAAGSLAHAEGPRLAPAAVADALTTAFMVMSVEEIADLCERSPGLEAWVLSAPGETESPDLLHFGSRDPDVAIEPSGS